MERINHQALLSAGFKPTKPDCDGNIVYQNGKLSVFYCGEVDRRFYLNHLYPFDFEVTHMCQLEKLLEVVNSNRLIHLEDPRFGGSMTGSIHNKKTA